METWDEEDLSGGWLYRCLYVNNNNNRVFRDDINGTISILLVRSRHKISQTYKTREEKLPIPLKAYAKPQQIRIAIRRGRDLCAEPPKYNKVQKRKETTNRKGIFVVAQPTKSWRASIHFSKNKRLHRAWFFPVQQTPNSMSQKI